MKVVRRAAVFVVCAASLTVWIACGDSSPPIPCGTSTCAGGEYCLHPCCGGAPPPCVDKDDAGVCPPGTLLGECATSLDGCYAPCTPPPPVCKPSPNDCESVSGGGAAEINGRDVQCGGCA